MTDPASTPQTHLTTGQPRLAGALAYGIAACVTAMGALLLSGDSLDMRILRETLPLALVSGGLAGYVSVRHWPRQRGAAARAGAQTAMAVLAVFCAAYLFGDALIESLQGGGTVTALGDGAARLIIRLPGAALLAVLSFSGAGLLLWSLRPRTE